MGYKFFDAFLVVRVDKEYTLYLINFNSEKGHVEPNISECIPEEAEETLPEDLITFCFPEGDDLKMFSELRSEEYTAVFTDSEGKRLYSFCRRFLPPTELSRYDVKERYPIVVCFVSHRPYFSVFYHLLRLLESKFRLDPEQIDDIVDEAYNVLLPPPGETFKIRGNTFVRPKDMDAPLIDVQFGPFVTRFDEQIIMKIISALMLEKRLIFVANEISTLSSVIHAAIAALCPFQWQQIFVPILPRHLMKCVCAPMPFVIGITRSHYAEMMKMPKESVYIVDIDEGTFTETSKDPDSFPYLQPKSGTTKSMSMSGVGKKLSIMEKSIGVDLSGLRNTLSKAGEIGGKVLESADGADPVSTCMKAIKYAKEVAVGRYILKETSLFTAFLTLQASIFGSYSRFFSNSIPPVFDRDAFVNTFVKEHPKSNLLEFLKVFKDCQMFETFATSRQAALLDQSSQNTLPDGLFEGAVESVKGAFKPLSIKSYIKKQVTSEPDPYREKIRPLVLAVSSNKSSTVPLGKTFRFLSDGTYDSRYCSVIMDSIWWRFSDVEGKNWKHGYKCLQLLLFLIIKGSERVITDTLFGIDRIKYFLHYVNDTASNRVKSAVQMRLLSKKIYTLLMETNSLMRERAKHGIRRKGVDDDELGRVFGDILGVKKCDMDADRLDFVLMFKSFDTINKACAPSKTVFGRSESSKAIISKKEKKEKKEKKDSKKKKSKKEEIESASDSSRSILETSPSEFGFLNDLDEDQAMLDEEDEAPAPPVLKKKKNSKKSSKKSSKKAPPVDEVDNEDEGSLLDEEEGVQQLEEEEEMEQKPKKKTKKGKTGKKKEEPKQEEEEFDLFGNSAPAAPQADNDEVLPSKKSTKKSTTKKSSKKKTTVDDVDFLGEDSAPAAGDEDFDLFGDSGNNNNNNSDDMDLFGDSSASSSSKKKSSKKAKKPEPEELVEEEEEEQEEEAEEGEELEEGEEEGEVEEEEEEEAEAGGGDDEDFDLFGGSSEQQQSSSNDFDFF